MKEDNNMRLAGRHHVSALMTRAPENVQFYTQILGMPLALPPLLELQREQIEANLQPIDRVDNKFCHNLS